MKRLALFSIMVAAAAAPVFSQSSPVRLSFEVASIKANTSGARNSGSSTRDGYFSAKNVTVKQLLMQAYRMQDFQIIGGPGWINADRFDIEARAESGAVKPPDGPRDPSRPGPMALMLQSLLEDRYELKIRHDMRDMPVYTLVVAKDGSKLKPTVEGKPGPGGPTPGSTRTNGSNGKFDMSGTGVPPTQLAAMLSQQLRRPVIDKTNLTGAYDFELNWYADNTANALAPAGDLPPASDAAGPSIFTAVQEQLGLKLESTKGPVEVLVIESIRKPSEN
jgi:uncharacterized protein (TIGR03435 family)